MRFKEFNSIQKTTCVISIESDFVFIPPFNTEGLLEVSTEGWNDIVEKIKEWFSRFIAWLKKVIAKIRITILKIHNQLHSIYRKFSYAHAKGKIKVSDKIQSNFNKNFCTYYKDIFSICTSLQLSKKTIEDTSTNIDKLFKLQPLDYSSDTKPMFKYVEDIFKEKKNKDTNEDVLIVSYLVGETAKFFIKDEEGNIKHRTISDLPMNKLDIKDLDLNYAQTDKYIKILQDSSRTFDNILNYVSMIEKKIVNYAKSHKDDKKEQKNCLTLTTNLCLDLMHFQIGTYSSIVKVMKPLVNDIMTNSYAGYDLLEKMFNDPNRSQDRYDLFNALFGIIIINTGIRIDPADIKNIVIKEKYGVKYFDLTDCGSSITELMSHVGGGCAVFQSHNVVEEKLRAYNEIEQNSDKEDKVLISEEDIKAAYTMLSVGVIFIHQKMINKLVSDTGVKEKFIFLHEQGHLVTGQADIPMVDGSYSKQYSHSKNETLADAYAIMKGAATKAEIIDWRIRTFQSWDKNGYKEEYNDVYRNNLEEALKQVKQYANLSILDMIRNRFRGL